MGERQQREKSHSYRIISKHILWTGFVTVDADFDCLTEIIFVRFLHSEFILFALFPIIFSLELDISSLHPSNIFITAYPRRWGLIFYSYYSELLLDRGSALILSAYHLFYCIGNTQVNICWIKRCFPILKKKNWKLVLMSRYGMIFFLVIKLEYSLKMYEFSFYISLTIMEHW